MSNNIEALVARILKLAAVAEKTNINESSAPWVAYLNEVCPANVRELIEALETRDKQIVELNTYRARRVSACINACEGISTENLLNNVPLKQGLSGLNQRIRDADAKLESEAKRNAELIAALEQAQSEAKEFRHRLRNEQAITEDADKRIAELQEQKDKWANWAIALGAKSDELEARQLCVKPRLAPHKYRECVNELLEQAIAYAGTQQLRERLAYSLENYIQPDHPHTRRIMEGSD